MRSKAHVQLHDAAAYVDNGRRTRVLEMSEQILPNAEDFEDFGQQADRQAWGKRK